ncbi:MAG: ferrochelatase [Acidobacteria bacterium]|nr:ferrochelatase [Acidobacteriota bacterium]
MTKTSPKDERIGVLLLNLGGPETLADVRPFLFNLFADPDIIRLPLRFLQKPLAWLIATQRYKKSSGYYAQIGGGSPLRKITDEQAQALKDELHNRGLDAPVYVAMRYWHPFTEEALEQIERDRITHLIILPLYPQFSISTTGSSLNRLNEITNKTGHNSFRSSVICSWQTDANYIKVLAAMVNEELMKLPDQQPQNTTIVFSAHSVPVRYIEEGDPYLDYTQQTVQAVMQEIGSDRPHTLSFQSKVGPVKWLRPSTDEAIRKLAGEGVEQILLVPISFVSEHIETLYELDILYKGVADAVGIKHYARVPALNCRKEFIAALATLVQNELMAETQNAKILCPHYAVNCQPSPICKAAAGKPS